MGKIDGDGIHPNPDKRPAPVVKSHSIDHEVEGSQREETETASDQNKRGSPNVFDNRELEAPSVAQGKTNEPKSHQEACFLKCRTLLAVKDHSGEHP